MLRNTLVTPKTRKMSVAAEDANDKLRLWLLLESVAAVVEQEAYEAGLILL